MTPEPFAMFDPPEDPPEAPARVTERDMLDALNRRHTQVVGNGDRWVRAEHVRNGTGFYGYDAEQHTEYGKSYGTLRIADYIALDGWESKGHRIHGFEVKVSRSDWLAELRDPDKAEAFRRYCHHWWLAVPDAAIVRDDLPKGWGLMVLGANGTLRIARRAPLLNPEPMPWPIVIGLGRAIQKTAARTMTA